MKKKEWFGRWAIFIIEGQNWQSLLLNRTTWNPKDKLAYLKQLVAFVYHHRIPNKGTFPWVQSRKSQQISQTSTFLFLWNRCRKTLVDRFVVKTSYILKFEWQYHFWGFIKKHSLPLYWAAHRSNLAFRATTCVCDHTHCIQQFGCTSAIFAHCKIIQSTPVL